MAEAPAAADGAGQRRCFLGIERSICGKRWEERLADPRGALTLAQRLGVSEVVGRVLAARGVSLEGADGFLSPTLREALPDPSRLRDMDVAAARVADALMRDEPIAIFGDYDVDGATSAALLARFLREAGREPRLYVPDRLREGYGPNAPALRGLAADGVRLVITVDCGITAFDPLEAAAAAGLDVIVVDHHAAEPGLPQAVAVVDPNRLDEPSVGADPDKLGYLAAVGVSFLLAVAVNRDLRRRRWYEAEGRREPDLLALLDLVALGTVCDVVPLVGLNRALVAQGLKVMARRANIGLAALCEAARLETLPEAYHAGFILGPRVNAGGRVGEAGLGARLLTTEDPQLAREVARQLCVHNEDRRDLEAAVLAQAVAAVEGAARPPEGLIFVVGEGWHPGVIGIVASRLKDRFNLPAVVVAVDPETGEGKGSGRSVPGVDLGAAVIAARQAGLLINGGGHPMAAGLTVAAVHLDALRAFLVERVGRALIEAAYCPALGFDGALQPRGATAELLRLLNRCAPFGTGNAQPRFALPAVRILRADVVGANHVRCVLGAMDGARLNGIAFRALDGPLGAALLDRGGRPLHVAGRLNAHDWAGPDKVQFIVEDAAPSAG